MISNVKELMKAEGLALTQPVCFGKYQGRYLHEIPEDYLKFLSKVSGNSIEFFHLKIKEARLLFELKKRRVILDISQARDGLYDHQVSFLEKFGDKNYGAMFFEMGLGKTLCILEYMFLRWQAGDTALIICPASVIYTWEKEIRKSYPDRLSKFAFLTGSGQEKLKKLSLPKKAYITNYETLFNDSIFKAFLIKKFTWIILDEAHEKIRSYKSKTTKRVLKLSSGIEMRFLMTGTPVANNEQDIWPQMSFLDRGKRFGGNFYKFRDEFFYEKNYQTILKKHKKEEFQKKLREVSITASKSDCLDLPDKIYTQYTAELSSEAYDLYTELSEKAYSVLDDEEIAITNKLVEIIKLHQVSGGTINLDHGRKVLSSHKLDLTFRIIDQLKKPVIVVCNYRGEVDHLHNSFKAKGLSVGRLDGNVSLNERREYQDSFSLGKLNVLLIQADCGLGIDSLQKNCHHMIFYSTNYRWDSRVQMEDRLHRTGQSRKVLYIDLLTTLPNGKPSIDHLIYQAVKNKNLKIKSLLNELKGYLPFRREAIQCIAS